MYECKFLTMPDMQTFLGLGRNRVQRLCKEKTQGFPAVKVGNRYQADFEMLKAWKKDWYSGKFEID